VKKIIFALFALAIAGFGFAGISRAQGFVILSSYYRLPGQSFSVHGGGFAPNSTLAVSFAGSSKSATTDGSGNLNPVSFEVPWSAINSNQQVTAGNSSAALTVGNLYPSVVPDSYWILPGLTASFQGSGFAPSENITVKRGGEVLGNASSSESGNFSLGPFGVGYAPGNQTYVFTGSKSQISYPLNITVASLNPWIVFNTYWAPAGASLKVSGNSFGANEQVSVYFAGQRMGTSSTDGSGRFSLDFAVPQGSEGPKTVEAKGVSSNSYARADFFQAR
jgi:hypothetical protein